MFCDYLRMTGCFRTKRKSMKQNQRKHYDRTFVDILLFFSLDKIAKNYHSYDTGVFNYNLFL